VFGAALAFSISIRFFDLFQHPFASIAPTSFLTILISPIVYYLTRILIKKQKANHDQKTTLGLAIASAVIAAAILFSDSYQTPPFPTTHTLEIIASAQEYLVPESQQVEILAILMPEDYLRAFDDLEATGNWLLDHQSIRTTQMGASIRYEEYYEGGARIIFRTSPDSGVARLIWDGKEQAVNLNSGKTGQQMVQLPETSWGIPKTIWKVLMIGMIILADYLSALFLTGLLTGLFFITVIAYKDMVFYIGKKINTSITCQLRNKIKFIPFLFMALIILNLLFFPLSARIVSPVTLLPSNSMVDLVKTYLGSGSQAVNLGMAFNYHLKDANLIISLNLLEDSEFSPGKLRVFVGISKTIYDADNDPWISEQEATSLLQYEHQKWPRLDEGSYYLIFPATKNERETYIVKRFGNDWFLIPIALLP